MGRESSIVKGRQHFALSPLDRLTAKGIPGLKWSDIDFGNQTIYVNRTLVYVTCKDETSPKYGKKINEFHEPKERKHQMH